MAPGTTFQPVLSDPNIKQSANVERVVFVSGKIYYDLVKEREKRGLDDKIAFIRIEVSQIVLLQNLPPPHVNTMIRK
jgi:probable 2-oxoglutarate dehydrogenase E1 component DHKTD1